MSKPKRKADIQITKDHPGAEEDGEETILDGSQQKATKEQMAKRRFVRAKRPQAPQPKEKEEQKKDEPEKKKENAFAAVSLKPSSSAFGSSTGFKGFGAASDGKTSVFGAAATGFKGFGTTTATKSSTDNEKKEDKPIPTFGGFASLTSQSSGSKPFVFGAGPPKTEDSSNTKTSPEAVVKLPQDFVVQSGEENEVLILEVRCKSFRWGKPTAPTAAADVTTVVEAPPSVPPTDSALFSKDDKKASKEDKQEAKPDESKDDNNDGDEKEKKEKEDDSSTNDAIKPRWIEVGIGPLRVLQAAKEEDRPNSFGRLVQRRQTDAKDNPTKVIVNLPVGKDSTVELVGEKHVKSASPSGQFLFKVKNADVAKDLHQKVTALAENSKSFYAAKDKKEENPSPKKDASPQTAPPS